MKATVEYEMDHYRDSIASGLKCLHMSYYRPREVTCVIVKAVQGLLTLDDDFVTNLQGALFWG